DEWAPSPSSLLLESPGRDDRPWWLGGRRVQVRGTDRSGATELHAPGAVLVQGLQLRVAGVSPELTAIRFSPDEIVRVLRAGSVELTERISVALDHGLVCWGIVADAPVPISLHWTAPLPPRPRPPADPAITSDDPEPDLPDPAPTLRLGNGANGLTVVACAGTVQRASTPGTGASVCAAEGDRMLRLVFAGGSLGEVQRSEEAFARRRLRAFRQDRILHARRLEQRLTALESVDAMLDRAVHWAKIRLDASVCEITGTGRMPRIPGSDGSVAEACAIAGAALVAGDREIALDLLRALARSGVEGTEGRAALGTLVQEYLAWTADQGSIERLNLGEFGPSESRGSSPASWDDSMLLRSATGWRPEADRSSSRILRGVIEGLWGIVPDGLNFGLVVRPTLPSAWPEMALRRLRVGSSLLDLRVRRRPGRVVLRVELLQGPRPRVVAELPTPAPVSQVTLDDEALGGTRATFEVSGSHEVSFYLSEGRGP
ncbi:MAG TPA: hypothetical protein VG817_04080, partial [Gemmatimonadales bacterium]|nr:hypothetical protein [Gemmatimonadales bacterium]